MPGRQRQNPSTQVPRTAADVLAEGWQDGDDFEISFMATDNRSPQTRTGQSGQQTDRRS